MLCGSNPLAIRSVLGVASAAPANKIANAKSALANVRQVGFIVAGVSDDFEVTLALPVGHGILPLAPLPFACRGKVIDEVVAEPVPRDRRTLEDFGRRRQGTW